MLNWLDQSFRDVRFAARSLFKNPGFTSVAVLSLALGIMATTAIYSVLHAVVLDPFPYKDVDHLMSVRVSNAALRGYRTGYSVDQFVEIARAKHDLRRSWVIASTISDVLWTRRRRSAAAARQPRHVQYLRRDGRAAAARPDAVRRRRAGRARSRSSSSAIASGSASSAATRTCSAASCG